MEVQTALDTGPYLNVIECFVAEGSLLIFTCTKIHCAGKSTAEGLLSGEVLAWVGEVAGKRFHVLPALLGKKRSSFCSIRPSVGE